MKRILIIVAMVAGLLSIGGVAQAGCPPDSIMHFGGAPGYPSLCLKIGDPWHLFNFIGK